jgi:hypothetical protein
VQPGQVVAPLDEDYGRYAALEPTTAEAGGWALPGLDAAGGTVLLRQLGQPEAARRTSVLLDQAPAHVAPRGAVPETGVLLWLPAYSPALHPGERLWEALKRRLDGRKGPVRASLDALQAPVAGLVQRYTAATIASLTGYPYLVEAAYALQF